MTMHLTKRERTQLSIAREILAPLAIPFIVTRTKRGPHKQLALPGGHKLPIAGSPSDWRSLRNFEHQLRRCAAAHFAA